MVPAASHTVDLYTVLLPAATAAAAICFTHAKKACEVMRRSKTVVPLRINMVAPYLSQRPQVLATCMGVWSALACGECCKNTVAVREHHGHIYPFGVK